MKAMIWNNKYWVKETDPDKLKKWYEKLLLKSGFKILKVVEYHFKPQGYTALFLLAESHLAIHTFPEENKSYIEISSCIEDKYRRFINEENSKLMRKTELIK